MTEIKTLTANKGEWSEFYAFIKLMADGKVYGADEKLKILDSIFYPIVKVIRAEARRPEFVYNMKECEDKVIAYDTDGNPAGEVKKLILKKHALDIFNKIKANQNGTFAIPERSTRTSFTSNQTVALSRLRHLIRIANQLVFV